MFSTEQKTKNEQSLPVAQRQQQQQAVAAPTPDSPVSSIAASPHWAQTIKDSLKASSGSGFSPFVAFCFTINCILGTGFLTIPWAFVQSGVVLSTIVLLSMCVFSDIAKDYLLESMARAEAMLDNRMHWVKIKQKQSSNSNNHETNEEQGLLVYSPVIWGGNATSNEEEEATASNGKKPATTPGTALRKNYHSLSSNNLVAPIEKVEQKQQNQNNRKLLGLGGASILPPPPTSATNTTSTTKSTPSSSPGTPNTRKRMLLRAKKQKYVVKHRKFEINTLCRVFLGKIGLRVHTTFVTMYFMGTLWAYTSVFASSMAKVAPIFSDEDELINYVGYAILFGLVVVPMSCLELNEQVAVQVFLTMCRFLLVSLMVGTSSLCASSVQEEDEENINNNKGIVSNESLDNFSTMTSTTTTTSIPMFRPSRLHKTLPILVFATLYHQSIPVLSQPVADKTLLKSIFRSTTIFCAIAYSFIGFVLGTAFGDNIEQSANLNWENLYRHHTNNNINANWMTRIVSVFIICFPALDVVSAYPLNAICLGNNMMGAFFGNKIHEVEKNRWIMIQFRLLASIPPIILGIFIRQLGTITDYAGTTGFIITFSIPSLLYIKSKALAKRKHFSTSTCYSGYASHDTMANIVCFFGVGMLAFVLWVMITEGA